MKEIGKRLRLLRETLGLTQEEFGKKIGRTKGAISAYEKGERTPDKTTLMLIEKVFNVNPYWFLKGEGNMFLEKYIPVEFYNDTDTQAKIIIQLSEEFVKQKLIGSRVSKLIAFPIIGNSMSPTIV